MVKIRQHKIVMGRQLCLTEMERPYSFLRYALKTWLRQFRHCVHSTKLYDRVENIGDVQSLMCQRKSPIWSQFSPSSRRLIVDKNHSMCTGSNEWLICLT